MWFGSQLKPFHTVQHYNLQDGDTVLFTLHYPNEWKTFPNYSIVRDSAAKRSHKA